MDEILNIIIGDLQCSPDLIVIVRFALVFGCIGIICSMAKNILRLGDR